MVEKSILLEIADQSRDSIVVLDKDCKIKWWNKTASEIFGFLNEIHLNQYFYYTAVSSQYTQDFRSLYQKSSDNNSSELFSDILELYLYDFNKTLFPAEIKTSYIIDNGEFYFILYIRDVKDRLNLDEEVNKLIEEIQVSRDMLEQQSNEQIQLMAKLEESESQLQELNASKDKFFSIIAHDLKGPFQGFLGFSQILANDLDYMDKDEIMELGQELHKSATNLFKLLENLLHWSRVQRGIITNNPENTFIKSMILINIELIRARAEEKGILIETDLDENIWTWTDENIINTVIRNLLSNAIKFTDLNDKIIVKTRNYSDDQMELIIEDTGVGMDEETKDKIFNIGSSHTTVGTRQEKGTGLGLILCKEMVELSGGSISLESTLGKGTSFSIILPKGIDNRKEKEELILSLKESL